MRRRAHVRACGFAALAGLAGAALSLPTQDFLAAYWQRPLAPQGAIPPSLTPPESSLSSQGCRLCHPAQFAAWTHSRHAQAMGAGVVGQLLEMSQTERQACLDCHAPLAEQVTTLDQALQESASPAPSLPLQGVTCSVCHLRQYRWHGPPRRTALPDAPPALPHGGWQAHEAFEDSRFCAACHQFPTEGNAVNGKLLENTYVEWQASPQARDGKTCQTCHMPDRQHLFRGIHDRATVATGVVIKTDGPVTEGNEIVARLALTNTGVGHRLPTYLTPRLILLAYQIDAHGTKVADSQREVIIGWSVSLDLMQEYADTRLAPLATALLQYRAPRDPAARHLVLEVVVEPEAFYTRFYEALLKDRLTDQSSALIRRALAASRASAYRLYRDTRAWE